MIQQSNKTIPSHARKEFAEWTSLFSGEIFVKIVAYTDESGRHDKTAKQKGSGQIVVAGWADSPKNWVKFCRQWQSILCSYGAPYFHFAEWADASATIRTGRNPSSSFDKNPYKGWTWEKLDSFLYKLAEVAGGGEKILIGSFVSTKDFAEAKKHPEYSRFAPAKDPYQACLDGFFESFSVVVQQERPKWKEPATFFFDQNKDDKEWSHSVLDAFAKAKAKDPRIAELSFVNSKIPPHIPIQSADMLSYRMRQIVEKFTDPQTLPNPSKLDELLIKPSFLRATPAALQGANEDYQSMISLRYGNYPWRSKNQS